jgi:hypothetical protein
MAARALPDRQRGLQKLEIIAEGASTSALNAARKRWPSPLAQGWRGCGVGQAGMNFSATPLLQ